MVVKKQVNKQKIIIVQSQVAKFNITSGSGISCFYEVGMWES